jgi:hypothetical protein
VARSESGSHEDGAVPVVFEINPVKFGPPLHQGKVLSLQAAFQYFDWIDAPDYGDRFTRSPDAANYVDFRPSSSLAARCPS